MRVNGMSTEWLLPSRAKITVPYGFHMPQNLMIHHHFPIELGVGEYNYLIFRHAHLGSK
jgi:hypothetical protein